MSSTRAISIQLLAVVLVISGCASATTVADGVPVEASNAPTLEPVGSTAPETSATTTTTIAETTDTSTTTTDAAPQAICADLLEGAEQVHPSEFEQPVADFDGDGIDDEIWVTDETDTLESSAQVVRSSDGAVSEPLKLWVAFTGFDGVLAASDIDSDGLDEIFYTLGGNTGLTGIIVELDGCELRAIATDQEAFDLYDDGVLRYLYFAGGNGCAPTGCYYSVSCLAGDDGAVNIVFTSIYPTISALDADFEEASLDQPIEELEVAFGQTTVTVLDGFATIIERTDERSVLLSEISEWASRPEVGCA